MFRKYKTLSLKFNHEIGNHIQLQVLYMILYNYNSIPILHKFLDFYIIKHFMLFLYLFRVIHTLLYLQWFILNNINE